MNGRTHYNPEQHLTKPGDPCIGSFDMRNRVKHDPWFDEFWAAQAFPGSISLDDLDARTVEAMVVMEGQRRLVEMDEIRGKAAPDTSQKADVEAQMAAKRRGRG